MPEENLFHCRVLYEDSAYAPLLGRQELEENVGIYLDDNYEQITVPVPHFGGSDAADIIHDFHRVSLRSRVQEEGKADLGDLGFLGFLEILHVHLADASTFVRRRGTI